MKRIYLPLLFIGLMTSMLLAQNPNDCDGARYSSEVFTDVTSTTVKFGENTDYQGDFQELYMDIYEPVGDVAAERPVVIMAFGGSFIGGDRSLMQAHCERFARKGYIGVAIDYRLYEIDVFNLPDSIVMLDVVVKAVADMKAAVRYLRKDAATDNTFRVDSDFIFVGGESAGGIVALHTAYLRADDVTLGNVPQYITDAVDVNGGYEGDTDDPANSGMGYSSEVQGVVNYFGALHRRYWLDSDDAPLISLHGTADDVVPYNHGYANIGFDIVTLDGSGVMHPTADAVGINNYLITVPGGGHGTFDQSYWEEMALQSGIFLEGIVCEGVNVGIEEGEDVSRQVVAAPNPATDRISIGFNGLNEAYNLTLHNALGQTIATYDNQTADRFDLDRNNLAAGLYMIHIDFENTDLAPVNKRVVFR